MPRPRVLVYSQQPRYLSGTLSGLAQGWQLKTHAREMALP